MVSFHNIILILISFGCSAKRISRIIDGTRLVGRKGPYDAVQYLVGIGTMHGVKWWTLGFQDFLKGTGLYGTLYCGGALLTPSIIQTSCHCVAQFDDPKTPSLGIKTPRINHRWEDIRVVYIGINDRFGEPFSMLTRPPVPSLKFFIHKLCAKIPKKTENTYDFGYIEIDPAWTKGKIGVPITRVTFAPTYTVEELHKIYRVFMLHQPVCLALGYGVFDNEKHYSDFIRAGWVELLNEDTCKHWTTYSMTNPEINMFFSWVCAQELPARFKQLSSYGDSGGTFTCDNYYFGVVAAIYRFHDRDSKDPKAIFRLNTHEALKSAVYQNAAQFRAAFEKEVQDWTQDLYVEIVRLICKRFCPVSFKLQYHQEAIQSSSNEIRNPSDLFVLLLHVLLFT